MHTYQAAESNRETSPKSTGNYRERGCLIRKTKLISSSLPLPQRATAAPTEFTREFNNASRDGASPGVPLQALKLHIHGIRIVTAA